MEQVAAFQRRVAECGLSAFLTCSSGTTSRTATTPEISSSAANAANANAPEETTATTAARA